VVVNEIAATLRAATAARPGKQIPPMSIAKTVTFPDRSQEMSEVSPERVWAVVSPPMELKEIDEIDVEWALDIISEIHELENAIADPTVVTEASEGVSDSVLRTARLAGASIGHIIVDEDDDVVDLEGHFNTDGPLFPKTGESLEAVLIALANERINELRATKEAKIVGFGAQRSDQRLNWRVAFWMSTEKRAINRAAEMNASRKSRSGENVRGMLATTSA
jgi:hypothetical protein